MSKFARICETEYCGKTLIWVVFSGSPTKDDARIYLAQLDTIYDRHCDFSIIYDATNIGRIRTVFFLQQVESMKKHDQDTRKHMERCVIVVKNKPMEFLLNTLFKLKPSACRDIKVFYEHQIRRAWWYLLTGKEEDVSDKTLSDAKKLVKKWKLV
jgi:hypothetical protein